MLFFHILAQSDKLRIDVLKLLSKYFTNDYFRLIPVNKFSIGSFFNHKDKLPLDMLSSVVYKFCCEHCSSGYVGMTSHNLYKRVAEHAGRSFRTGSNLSVPPHSAIRDHSNNCNIPINLNSFTILDSASNAIDLRILESLHIVQVKPSLNNTNSSFPLKIAPG